MPRVDPDVLQTFVGEILEDMDVAPDVADTVAAALVGADLRGHYTHGVRLLPNKYAREVAAGDIRPSASPEIARHQPPFALVDGQRAFGHAAAREAVDIATTTAAENGIGIVGVRNVSHIGRVGEWAERATASEMAFVAFVCNPGSQWVAPPGSAARRLSTNPVAIGLPTFDAVDFPLVLDMATSQVARGKVGLYAAEGKSLPDQWVVTDAGDALREPERFENGDGALRPLGGTTAGHKGFGLSVMSELLAANLSDWFVSGQEDVVPGNTAVFIAIDLTKMTSRDAIAARTAAFAEYIHSTEFSSEVPVGNAAEGDETLLPGEAEYRIASRQREAGIDLPGRDADSLRELAIDRGLGDSIPAAIARE
jgi:uncharacterized oxidoreductase